MFTLDLFHPPQTSVFFAALQASRRCDHKCALLLAQRLAAQRDETPMIHLCVAVARLQAKAKVGQPDRGLDIKVHERREKKE